MSQPQLIAPYSQEGEEAVLGALMTDPAHMNIVSGILRPDDFYIVRHARIYSALLAIHRRGDAVDFVTVQDQLRADGTLSEIGGGAYLLTLINATPTSQHALVYAKLVTRTSERRRGLRLADEIRALMLDEQLSTEDVRAEILNRLREAQLGRSERNLVTIAQAVQELEQTVEATQNLASDALLGVPTGFTSIDRSTEGFQLGDLIYLGARPSMGKTAFMMTIALNLAKMIRAGQTKHLRGRWIYVWTGEMRILRLMQRIVGTEAKINSMILRRGLRDGGMNQPEIARYIEQIGKLGALPIVFDDTVGITPSQMRVNIAEGERYWGAPAMLFGDYLGLMNPDNENARANKEQQTSGISRSLKHIATEFNAPMMMAVQLNRNLENRDDKRPQMSDLRDSGAIEQDGDIVSFLYRHVVYEPTFDYPNQTEWIWAKNRDGEIGTKYLEFDRKHTTFYEPNAGDAISTPPLANLQAGSGAKFAKRVK